MNVEITQDDIEKIKARIIEEQYQKLKKQADDIVQSSMLEGHFIGEIRGLIASEIARDLSDRVMRKFDHEKLIDAAIESTRQRISMRVEKKLRDGIVVKFAEDLLS